MLLTDVMATSNNEDMQKTNSTVGFLLIIGEIISNEQRDEICTSLKKGFKKIDSSKYHEIIDLFNDLLHENEFQAGLFQLECFCYFMYEFCLN